MSNCGLSNHVIPGDINHLNKYINNVYIKITFYPIEQRLLYPSILPKINDKRPRNYKGRFFISE